MRVAALAKQEEGAGDDEYAPVENAAVPLLSHMKSDPRTCRELGFSLGGSGGSFSALAGRRRRRGRDEAIEVVQQHVRFDVDRRRLDGRRHGSHDLDGAVRPSVSEPSVSRMSSVQSVVCLSAAGRTVGPRQVMIRRRRQRVGVASCVVALASGDGLRQRRRAATPREG